ncbi:NAD-dependent epimerase/dehydratase family protein [Deinococcus pimensis]|uniref:NAD-dependent epimerase/dehydratase family protein n=1 Tax=Deinococcus pimensis TaxID=309888 RepID=UPI000482C68A|nr:NAD-dependent epimerase/dehydratase family protein [Deinococcus pimensis]
MRLPLDAKIYVTGHADLVGGAVVRQLRRLGYDNIVTFDERHFDLRDQDTVNAFFERELPDYVILSSTKVSGVVGDAIYPAQWLRDNIMIATNVIHASYLYEVERLLNLDCGHALLGLTLPSLRPEPYRAELLEETGRACSVARSVTVELCDSYRTQYGCDFKSAVVSALYGPEVDVENANGHFIASLVDELLAAKETGASAVTLPVDPETTVGLVYVDDLADACLYTMERESEAGAVDLGPPVPPTLCEVASGIRLAVGYAGTIDFSGSTARPAGRAGLDTLRQSGWTERTPLHDGLDRTCDWYARRRSLTAQR